MQLNVIHCMDCLEGLKLMADSCVDLIVTDPPYGISYKSNSGSDEYKDRVQHTEWDKDFNFAKYWAELWRVLKDNSDAYVFGRWENYETMKSLTGFKQILIWNKCCGGLGDLTCYAPSYELIFYFKKGKRPLTKRDSAILKFHSQTSWKNGNPIRTYKHPTQKPLDIIRYLILQSSKPKDLVLDAFIGSGTTACAAKQLDRNCIGFEINPEYVKIANERLYQNVFDFSTRQ